MAAPHTVRLARRRHALPARRSWRRRSRRAQVSAIATLLGLLIVVTFIANYLATTLPNTMGQNDLQHELLVENEVAELSARAEAVAMKDAVGAQVSQPLNLGSQGAPPFAGPDGGSLTSLAAVANASGGYPSSSVAFALTGPAIYTPPTGGTPGGYIPKSDCTNTSSSIICSGSAHFVFNFTGSFANQGSYAITLSGGGTAIINISTSHSTVTVTPSATTVLDLDILGSNDTVTVTVSTVPETIVIFGSYDTLEMTGSASPSTETNVLVVGNHDTVTTTALSGTNTVVVSAYGSNDAVNPGTLSGTTKFGVYFNGYNPASPSNMCPVDNLSSSDTVGQPTGGTNTLAVTYNNTVYSGSGTNGAWSVSYRIPTQFACPFVAIAQVSFTPTGLSGFVVRMQNTYVPASEVAYDQGAVVYAQPGSIPLFLDPPPISFAHGTLALFVPWFRGTLPGDFGTGTADLSLRLLSAQSLAFPPTGFTFQSGSSITITVVTPYAAAWYAFYQGQSAFASYVTCSGSSNVCTAFYNPNGLLPLGTVTLTIPASKVTTFALTIAEFAASLT